MNTKFSKTTFSDTDKSETQESYSSPEFEGDFQGRIEVGLEEPFIKGFNVAEGLIKKSKKIYKRRERTITLDNSERLANFFSKWKKFKKGQIRYKCLVRSWYTSYDQSTNRTYIYKNIKGIRRRTYFRIVLSEQFQLEDLRECEWPVLFLNLVYCLNNRMDALNESIIEKRKSHAIPIWIEDMATFGFERRDVE